LPAAVLSVLCVELLVILKNISGRALCKSGTFDIGGTFKIDLPRHTSHFSRSHLRTHINRLEESFEGLINLPSPYLRASQQRVVSLSGDQVDGPCRNRAQEKLIQQASALKYVLSFLP